MKLTPETVGIAKAKGWQLSEQTRGIVTGWGDIEAFLLGVLASQAERIEALEAAARYVEASKAVTVAPVKISDILTQE